MVGDVKPCFLHFTENATEEEVEMSECKDINFDHTQNPNTNYNFNAFGSTTQIPDNNLDGKGFYNRHWKWALAQATEMMRPLAERFGNHSVSFSAENDDLVIDSKESINELCHGVLGTESPRDLFGCTTQDDWLGAYNDAFSKPPSTTYLAEDWAYEYISNAAHHELSHQAIVTVRQMLQKDHKNRRNKGDVSLDDITFDCFMNQFKKIDSELDAMDSAHIDKQTGKIVIDKKSDVWPMLNAVVDVYCEYIRNGIR